MLTTPSLAPRLEQALARVLAAQLADGNWPASDRAAYPGSEHALVQFCQGAPGVVHSLQRIREHFPTLAAPIADAIRRGTECTWKYGLVRKEPTICHGIFGNAL